LKDLSMNIAYGQNDADLLLQDLIRISAELSGGMAAMTKKLGVARSAPYSWKRIPADRVLQIEAATGGRMSRYTLRPDLYPRD
jgi:DNA-binding transcriptional regulator YdaS (Cro superfamily)